MKKGWKVFWIVCIFLAVLGIALCISGAVLGATVSGVRKVFGFHDKWESYFGDHEATTYETSECVDPVSGSYGEGSATSYGESSASGSTEHAASTGHYSSDSASVFRFSDIRELDIDVNCVEVDIVRGEGDEIVVDTSDITEKMSKDLVIVQKDAELKAILNNRKYWDSWSKNKYKSQGTLVVRIPEGTQFDEAALKVGAGVLFAEEIQARELEIEVGAGQVSLASFIADEIELECGVGEADVRGDAAREAKIECGIGSVTYTALGAQQDYNYELSCGIGELMIGNDSFSGLGSERKINNGGNKNMEVECGIGTVIVQFEG